MTRQNIIVWTLIGVLTSAVLVLSVLLYIRSKEIDRNRITPEEWMWLASNEGNIKVGTEPSSPPLSYDENDQSMGFIHDYLRLLEKKLNITFNMVKTGSFSEMIEMGKTRKIDIVAGIIETPERMKHFLFTKPVVEYPLVILVESNRKEEVDSKKLSGMKIVATEGYSVVDYLRKTYPGIDLHTVKDDFEAFKEVSFGGSDAVVTDLPTANAMISKWGFGNLKVAGDLGYNYQIRIASRNDYPELNRILDKAVFSLSREDVIGLENKWQIGHGSRFYVHTGIINASLAVVSLMLLILFSLFVWNRFLKVKIEEKTRALDDHNRMLEEQVTLKSRELIIANADLSKALSEMKTLKGLLPICLKCKMVRDDEGFWRNVDVYLASHTKAQFSHGICPDCARRIYPELYKDG